MIAHSESVNSVNQVCGGRRIPIGKTFSRKLSRQAGAGGNSLNSFPPCTPLYQCLAGGYGNE